MFVENSDPIKDLNIGYKIYKRSWSNYTQKELSCLLGILVFKRSGDPEIDRIIIDDVLVKDLNYESISLLIEEISTYLGVIIGRYR